MANDKTIEEIVEECTAKKRLDYTVCNKIKIMCDEYPDGWANLVESLCNELAPVLEEINFLEEYVVLQAKEKFGELRWYDNCDNEKVREIIRKYEDISKFTCVTCGKPAKYETVGYISPFCEDCIKEIKSDYVPINDFYNFK